MTHFRVVHIKSSVLQQIFPMYSVHAGESAGFQGGGGGGGGLDVPGDGEIKVRGQV